MKILIASDLHLSDRVWKYKPIEGDSYYSWRQIVEIARSQGVDAVILAGDLLDRQVNNSRPVSEFLKGLSDLSAADIDVYYIQGQHEYQDVPWGSLAGVAIHVHKKSLQLGGLHFFGLDFLPREEFQKAVLEIPPATDVLIAHQVWEDFMGENIVSQGKFSDLPPHISLLITGDYHDSRVVCQGGLTVVSPGSTAVRQINERADKYCYLLNTEEIGEGRWADALTAIPLATRRVISIDCREMPVEELEPVLLRAVSFGEEYAREHSLPEQLAIPLVALRYNVSIGAAVMAAAKSVNNRLHFFYKPETTPIVEGVKEDFGHEHVSLMTLLQKSLEGDLSLQELSQSCMKSPENALAIILAWAMDRAEERSSDVH